MHPTVLSIPPRATSSRVVPRATFRRFFSPPISRNFRRNSFSTNMLRPLSRSATQVARLRCFQQVAPAPAKVALTCSPSCADKLAESRPMLGQGFCTTRSTPAVRNTPASRRFAGAKSVVRQRLAEFAVQSSGPSFVPKSNALGVSGTKHPLAPSPHHQIAKDPACPAARSRRQRV